MEDVNLIKKEWNYFERSVRKTNFHFATVGAETLD